jgi:DNA phosphorothioation-dependent restriction protein DptH
MSEVLLQQPDTSNIAGLWVDALESRLRSVTADADQGQCLRVVDLPRQILEHVARRLSETNPADVEVYLVDRVAGPEPWRVGVHKVIERRNADVSILALFPPDLQLAAGDSVDISTFKAVKVDELHDEIIEALMLRITPQVREQVQAVMEYLKRKGWPLPNGALIEYMATVAAQNSGDPAIVGGALYALGLIPDFRLLDRPDEFHYRLGQRNMPIVRQLCDSTVTPVQRVLRLPVTDASFRDRLLTFFVDHPIEDVSGWGGIVASDARWRDVALECWPLGDITRPTSTMRIDIEPLKLPKRNDDGTLVFEANKSDVKLGWQTTPPPIDVPGLAHFRVEVVNSDRQVVWESPLIKNGGGKTPRRQRTIKDLGLDSGVYFFRVIALDTAGDPFPLQPYRDSSLARNGVVGTDGEAVQESDDDASAGKRINESGDFQLLADDDDDEPDDDIEPITNTIVASYAEAELLYHWHPGSAIKDIGGGRGPTLEWTMLPGARGEIATASIRFDLQHQYSLRLSRRLRDIERRILQTPPDGGHYRLQLRPSTGDSNIEALGLSMPDDVLETRRAVLDSIASTRLANEQDEGSAPVVALINLLAIRPLIERYAEAYRRWLDAGDEAALKLDVILVTVQGLGQAALLAPTHPIRLLWLMQRQQLARSWVTAAAQRPGVTRSCIDVWREALGGTALPLLLVLGATDGFIEAGALPGGWGLYLPPGTSDPRLILGAIRKRFGLGSAHHDDGDSRMIADKLALFLRQHPYAETLSVNVINPGDAAVIRDALIELERSDPTRDTRYIVRLFSNAQHGEGVGGAFRELVDPESQIAAAADRLMRPGLSFLFPRLSWSRHTLQAFVEQPDEFPAHVTVILDAFPLHLRVSSIDVSDRTSFVHGLVQDVPRRFLGRGKSYAWGRRAMPSRCPELPGTPAVSEMLAGLLLGTSILQARTLAPVGDRLDAVAVPRLDLSAADQSLLYSAHSSSTWVFTLDANFGLDYYDALRLGDRTAYLLDFTPEFVATGNRQLLLTTRIDDEVDALLQPAVATLGMAAEQAASILLLEALRSLSGRLALRLLSAPSQVKGALGMALARLFLRSYGLLDSAVVIPLDAHLELSQQAEGDARKLRGDLLLVSADTVDRRLECVLVEAKFYSGIGISADLRTGIAAQLAGSESALRNAFDPEFLQPDRLDRSVQSWRLATVLTFYLDRALRYGLLTRETAHALRAFFLDLDRPYWLAIRKIGLVFRPEGTTTFLDQEDPDVPIWVVGRDEIARLVGEALQAATLDGGAAQDGAPGSEPASTMPRQQDDASSSADSRTVEDVRQSFGDPATRRLTSGRPSWSLRESTLPLEPSASSASSGEPIVGTTRGDSEAPEDDAPHDGETPAAQEPIRNGVDADVHTVTTQEQAHAASSQPEASVLLGDTHQSPQYGLLGAVAGESRRFVALDLNGCNTISVFGVQGSGKSYTVGSVIEMALRGLPGINVLPKPLGAVVFHYHQTQDYPPEFVSMTSPNDDPRAVEALAAYGAVPAGLDDVLILTTNDMVETRRREFPNVSVAPIAFSSAELTVSDWRFLMGASGNDALYLKLLNEIMRKQRANLTLEAIQHGLSDAPFSDSQRVLTQTRLDFASRFIDDNSSLRSALRPGRLIIVDLRDEFVEREQALGLFVSMLNVFSGAGLDTNPYNKLIVFDEAHKYMGGALIGQVVELIREMRHKGVSLVVASQDPIHVPAAVIELSSAIILHRFNAPTWLKHIQKSVSTLNELTPTMLASLSPGDAFIWSNKATDLSFTRRAVKVQMRPRVTLHGGGTQTAVSP